MIILNIAMCCLLLSFKTLNMCTIKANKGDPHKDEVMEAGRDVCRVLPQATPSTAAAKMRTGANVQKWRGIEDGEMDTGGQGRGIGKDNKKSDGER